MIRANAKLKTTPASIETATTILKQSRRTMQSIIAIEAALTGKPHCNYATKEIMGAARGDSSSCDQAILLATNISQ